MSQYARFPLVVALLASVSAPALAQTAQGSPPRITENVVVTAGVAPVPIDLVSRTLTVLVRTDLEGLGVTGVADALRLAPGVDVRARGTRDTQTDFSLRGATFGQSLVLVDGIRLNDSQSGHHNGDIPVALVGLERIEVVTGGASAVHGADALGGAINMISRRDAHATGTASVGQHGLVSGQVSLAGFGLPEHWMVSGWGSRSSGFMFDREFAHGGAMVRGQPGAGWTLDLRHQQKAFGANGFYGPSPSKEWTDQTTAAATWRRLEGTWTTDVRTAYRNHGDHFRWDINRPGFAENRHRTNAVETQGTFQRALQAGGRLTIGGLVGGDWIRSSNLGDHEYARAAGFAELQAPIRDRTLFQAGLRFDGYSTFGSSLSPSASVSTWFGNALRLRASVARAFRVPTFTELYYTDPAHAANSDLTAEHGWSLDGGVDLTAGRWTLSVSPFVRWDNDVIDWVRVSAAERWGTTNVRDVTATGVETSIGRAWGAAFFRGHYAAVRVKAPDLSLLSKYVKEYVPHTVGASVLAPLGGGVRLALTADHRRRLTAGVLDAYTLVGIRLAKTLGRFEWHLDATNLLNEDYREIAGVDMPGRWISVGVTIR